MVKNFSN
jgi:hypothetical protein